ncbi:hypothetical protein [Nocardia sp. NPDC057353]|uniref:hypothetical protein n=1 Tax=Nocardia sp. NPDC057353 TaxID=3346104 RepID=UPI00363DCB10
MEAASAPWSEPGLPRRRIEGLPVPWITPVWWGAADWKCVDTDRLRRCQAEWLCQVCGDPLPERAWVIVEAGDWVLGDAALHETCLRIARRWCPHLDGLGCPRVEVDRAGILAGGRRLSEITEYGDEELRWTLDPHRGE